MLRRPHIAGTRDVVIGFAYGSNMLSARLRDRAPSARSVGIGRLERYALRWHKCGRDGSGKCDAERTAVATDIIWGVLFEIDRPEKLLLDAAEGLGQGYDDSAVDVVTDMGRARAWIYHATNTDASLRPYNWYKALVVAGAREHGLPEAYVRRLEAVDSIVDPDSMRAARNAKLLA